jgi:pyruvate dehydrogenase E1 component beta subunit
VVIDESPPRCGLTADVAAMAAERVFHSLKAPVKQVCAPHSPVPFSPELEAAYLPSVERIKAAIRETAA